MIAKDRIALGASAGLATVVLAGCGGGSSSATVQGLSVPGQVNLVDAQNTGSLRLPEGVRAAVTYDSDPVQFWIHDEAMEPLETVNMILCSVQQTRYDDPAVLNQGPYIALVKCEERGSDGGGQGRGGDTAQYDRFVVNSKRASTDAPHIVDFWLENTGPNDQPGIIYGKVTISSSPTAEAPYGEFTLQFKQLLLTQAHDDDDIQFRGYLKTVPRQDGQAEFAFWMQEGDPDGNVQVGEQAFRQRARLVGQPSGTTGRAFSESKYVANQGGGPITSQSQYYLQFNSNYVARKKISGASTTKVFDRNNFTTYVYRYGVYDATTNERIDTLSGFGVEDANGVHGWAGYHGLWFPEHITITDGQQLTRRSYSSSTPDRTYTAVIVPGRLEKNSREASMLGNLLNEDLEVFDFSSGAESRVRWNGTDLVRVATRDGQGNWILVNPSSVSGSYTAGDWVDFYSRDRGDVQMIWPAVALSDSTPVYLWTHETMTADSPELANGDLTLYGYYNRLRSNITQNQANFANSETPFFADATNVGGVMTYVFGKTSQMLTLTGQPVRLADGVTVQGGPGQWGFECGPMFTSTLATLDDHGNQTTSYHWRTGLNQWNQLRTIRDDEGEIVAFSPPIRLPYTHSEPTNTNFHNKSFSLEWTGTDLQGVPYLESQERWRPAFNIPSGTTVTSGQTTYKIKQLEGEQEMNEVGNPSAIITQEGFDLDVTLTAPDDEWVDPAVGAMPVLTSAPLFVEGVRQSDS